MSLPLHSLSRPVGDWLLRRPSIVLGQVSRSPARRLAALGTQQVLYVARWSITHRPRQVVHGAIVGIASLALVASSALGRPALGTAVAASPADSSALAADAVPAAPALPSLSKPAILTHAVTEGETLVTIAQQYHLKTSTILGANDLPDPDLLSVGQTLLIPPADGAVHVVQGGEALNDIATRAGVDLSTVLAANDLGANPDNLAAGTRIFLPGVASDPVQPRADVANGTASSAGAAANTTGSAGAGDLAASDIGTHTVAPGESVVTIASDFGISPSTVVNANRLPDADNLQVGEDLVIPATDGVLHTVQPGDSLHSVAAEYSVAPGVILDANRLPSPDILPLGEQIVVPGATQPAPEDRVAAPAPAGSSSGSATSASPASNQTAPANTARGSTEQHAASDGAPTDLPSAGQATTGSTTRSYTVQPGDTLVTVANTFGVDVQTILSNNGISDPDSIKPGTNLSILPVSGVAHTVQPGETLAHIAGEYQVDLGLLLDYNNLADPNVIPVGSALVVPGATAPAAPVPSVAPHSTSSSNAGSNTAASTASSTSSTGPSAGSTGSSSQTAAAAPAHPLLAAAQTGGNTPPASMTRTVTSPATQQSGSSSQSASSQSASSSSQSHTSSATQSSGSTSSSSAPAHAPAPSGASGSSVVAAAMRYVGSPYVWGGTSPSGFDCSGFVYYVNKVAGISVGRGLWEEYNAGAHISLSDLQPGDAVFFANTYTAGLSHDGIYLGGGQFVHAADESTGVVVSSMNTSYWQSHYVGATRIRG